VKQRAKNRAGSVCNRPLPPPPPTPGPVGRNSGVSGQVRSKSESAGPGQVEIRECRARSDRNPRVPGRVRSKSGSVGPGLSITDLSLPHPPRRAQSARTLGPVTDTWGALCTGFTLVTKILSRNPIMPFLVHFNLHSPFYPNKCKKYT
jgi:hypothetical protein